MIDFEQTIVAIASPTSPSYRGIVRLSGTNLPAVLTGLGLPSPTESVAHRYETVFQVSELIGGLPVSVLHWPTARSYTGQPAVEFHTTGSPPVLQALVHRTIENGARAARPGEFTMRAFLAGRLDLTQAEAVLGVIEAEGRGSLDLALQQLAGNVSKPIEALRASLIDLLADIEAGLDFVDEDIEFIDHQTIVNQLRTNADAIEELVATMTARSGSSGRTMVAICGEPNAGKSSLCNRLSFVDAAIVSEQPGTTRDVVTTDVTIHDRPLRLADTAGLESPQSQIEHQAQFQSNLASRQATLRLWCVDQGRPDVEMACARVRAQAAEKRSNQLDLWVATKADIASRPLPPPWLSVSALTGAGIAELERQLDALLSRQDLEETGSVIGTATRCRETLLRAGEAIQLARALAQQQEGHELIATELRITLQCLGEVTGAVYTDDILDQVFGRFCIGK